MRKHSILALCAALAIGMVAGQARADVSLYTGAGFQGTDGSLVVTYFGNTSATGSGSIGLPPNNGSINGVAVSVLYCVDFATDINVPGTYPATLSSTGIIHGALIPNAGQIAWLMDNISPIATTSFQQEGLQAAIWKQVYGVNFDISPLSAPAVLAFYNFALAALGSNVAPVSDVIWISPYQPNTNDTVPVQGLIAPNVPEPSTFVVWSALGMVSVVIGRWQQRRKG